MVCGGARVQIAVAQLPPFTAYALYPRTALAPPDGPGVEEQWTEDFSYWPDVPRKYGGQAPRKYGGWVERLDARLQSGRLA